MTKQPDEVTEPAPASAPTPATVGAHVADPLDALADEIASTLRATKDACRRIEAQAEERAARTVEEAGAQAEELVAGAEAAAEASRTEAQQRLDEATRSRDAAEATLARTRKLLADAESELARSIEQASTVRAALEAIRVEASSVEPDSSDAGAPAPTGDESSEVIDLTDDAAHDGSGAEDLEAPLRDAVARAVDDASTTPEPSD